MLSQTIGPTIPMGSAPEPVQAAENDHTFSVPSENLSTATTLNLPDGRIKSTPVELDAYLNQAPRQAKPKTGSSERGVIHPVRDGFTYLVGCEVLRVIVETD